jgi:hypothetical protein
MLDSLRASQLATGLPAARITLPPGVTAALRAYDATRQMTLPAPPQPGELVAAALAQAAHAAVQAAAKTGTITLDARWAGPARLAEAEARDRAQLATTILAAAEAGLCAATSRHAAALTTAIQARHAAIITELAGLAATLPPGIDNDTALERGGPVREAYLTARDRTAELASLRDLLMVIHPDARFRSTPAGMERAAMYCRSFWLYDNSHRYPQPGSLAFWLQLVTEAPDAIWCPLPAEAETRLARLVEERRLEGAASMPAGTVVY